MADTVILSRWQFAVTIGFHFMFVTLSLGTAWLLFTAETFAWRTGDAAWRSIGRFLGKLFAITFAFGAATGIVMEFQFGTNWAVFSKYVGDIFGPPLAAETMFAFFLESVFIGVYIFGRDRISKTLHWLSALLVATGATISAFWILVADSWMQTPAGYTIKNGVVKLEDFSAALFNPSIWPRFFHTVDGVIIAGAFFVSGISAWYLLKNPDNEQARKSIKLGIVFAFAASLLELFPFGHIQTLQVYRTQPSKFAAFEAVEKTQTYTPIIVFGIPHENPPRLEHEIRIDGFLSWLVGGLAIEVPGMDSFKPEDLPPFTITFLSFHLMVYFGLFFIAVSAWGFWKLYFGGLYRGRPFLWLLLINIPLPILACQLGWITAEVGRQPWIVYKLLRTSEAVSKIQPGVVWGSLIFFILLYTSMTAVFVYIITYIVRKGPESVSEA